MNIDWKNMTPELYEEMFEEEWRPVNGFLLYNVSNYGRIMNVKSGRILRQFVNQNGYMTLTLSRGGERYAVRVHRIVGEAFCEVPNGYDINELDVDHGDGCKKNNHAYNLEWVTRKENAGRAFDLGLRHAPRMKKIRIIETGDIYGSIRECARAIGRETDQRSINEYLAGRAKHVKGYHFELV